MTPPTASPPPVPVRPAPPAPAEEPPPAVPSPLRLAGAILQLAAAYFAIALLGARISPISAAAEVAPFYPAAGVALAGLLLGGWRLWPGVLIGSLALSLSLAPTEVGRALVASGANTVEALFGLWLVRHFIGPARLDLFARVDRVILFILLAILLRETVSATLVVSYFHLSGIGIGIFYLHDWWTWYVGGAMGALLTSPFALVWSRHPRSFGWSLPRIGEAIALLALTIWAGGLPFGPLAHFTFLSLVPLIWAAFRFGRHGATLCFAGVSLAALAGASLGSSQVTLFFSSRDDSIILAQLFVGVTGLVSLLLSALLEEHRQSEETLQNTRIELEERVRQRSSESTIAEEKFRSIFDRAICGVFQRSPDGSLLTFNPALARIYGYSGVFAMQEDLAARPRLFYTDPSAWPDMLAEIDARGGVTDLESEILGGDGLRRWIAETLRPVTDRQGRVRCYEGFVLDVTERRRSQDALRRSEERLSELIRSSPLGFFDCDYVSGQCYYSPRWKLMLGYDPHELPDANDTWSGLLHPEDRPVVLSDELSLGRGWDSFHMEFRMKRRDGSWLWIEATGLFYRNADGRVVRSLGFHADIEARKQAEQTLRSAKEQADAANRAKSEFLSTMSHEIRTPMNAILGFSSLLAGLVHDPKGQSYLASIASSGRSLLELIDDLLDISRIEAGRLEIRPSPVPLRPFLGDIQRVFAERASQKNLSLHARLADSLPSGLMLDEARTRQVLVNILGNAIKFTEQGGVTLTASTVPSTAPSAAPGRLDLVIEIADTGIGIPPDKLESIFDPFTQVSGQHNRRYGGTGLGLAICRRLVGVMGGSISVRSQPGEGSTFRLEFHSLEPAHIPAAPAVPSLPTGDIPISRLRPSTILIAEDEEINHRVMGIYFKNSGHRLLKAINGNQALEIAAREQPDLILMDVRMPGLDGVEATRRLKADPAIRHIPVIVLSAFDMEEESDDIRSIFDGFLKKPPSKNELARELARLLPLAVPIAATPPLPVVPPPDNAPATPGDIFSPADPELARLLRAELRDHWPLLQQTLNFHQIEQFALRVKEAADHHHQPSLIKYAETLWRQAQELDIENLPATLEIFPRHVQSLCGESE